MSTTINGVTVKMGRLADDWRKHAIIVQVASRVKPGLKAAQEIDPGKAINTQALIEGIGAAAALGAEYLCRKYHDPLDPHTCARDGIKAFGEEVRLIAELAKDMPKKVRRLYESRDRLTAQEGEVVERMRYLIDKGESLTVDEADWVNQKVGQLHGDQL